jgi:predicted AlkP superfamily phosphohydrolase/phosphomutase
MVELALDRLQHGFWHLTDPEHRRFEPRNPFEHAIRDYYRFLDRQIGELLDILDLDDTAVWVVSDHGAKRLDGSFALNDWLIREGLLVLKSPSHSVQRFDPALVDWSRTKVWGEGGYHGQLYINKAGREPQGIVRPDEYGPLRETLTRKLAALSDHRGQPFGNRVFRPDELYPTCRGCPPDLIVLFGDLHWRCVAAVGHSSLHVFSDDPGAEEANHAQAGLYILSHPSLRPAQRAATLYDVVPTSLRLLRLAVPPTLRGVSLVDPP